MLNKLLIIFLGIFSASLVAQEIESDSLKNPMDELGVVSDAFQENFFEALKQKAIENYELAINALNKAEAAAKSAEERAVVHFELGKNYTELKVYDAAESNYKQVLNSLGNRLDVLEHLYDLYYRQKDYEKAIPLVKTLITFDEDYKEDYANLLSLTKQYDKALLQLDELDQLWGQSDIRNALRAQIYRATGNTEGAIENLEDRIELNPKNEREYLNLIFLYSDQGNTEKAFETAKTLLKNNPNSQLVHLALYKFYLDAGDTAQALNSMEIVFASEQIDLESKYRVLGDFIQYVNQNPDLEQKLVTMTSIFSEENGGKVYEKVGDYFSAKNKKEEALQYYEKGIALTPDSYNLLKNTLLLQLDVKKFREAAILSQKGIDVFPAQALLYLLNGVANNGLQHYSEAIENLEMGIDFLLDDPQMEYDFYNQLHIAYKGKGDQKKAKFYGDKATNIKLAN